MSKIGCLLLLCMGFLGVVAAGDDRAEVSLESLFRSNSHVLKLEDGDLSGPGVEFLLAETVDAQFVCVAEPHNSQQIPMFVTSLFQRLQDDRSFDYLAIEQGPLIVRRIAELGQTSTNDELRKLMKKRKKALHFETFEEVAMIADVARLSSATSPNVWGLDRVLDPSYVEQWLASEDGRDDPEASFLRERMEWSAENFAMYKSKRDRGDGPSADQFREDGFKEGFRHYYDRVAAEGSPPPRVIFRFGHTHMGRVDYRSYASLGRYLGEFAAQNDLRAFHLNLQAINQPGQYWSLTDYPEYEPLANVGDPAQWVLVDLRPAREPLRAGTVEASQQLKRMVFNFDAVLLIGGLSKGGKL
ncbi:hypothetical protein N9971_00135 [bacterium]|nr:hypothetical protein [bacterium]